MNIERCLRRGNAGYPPFLIVVVDTKLNCSELVTWYYQYSQSQLCRDWDNTQDNIMIHKVSGEMPAHSQSSLMLITSCNYICLLLSCSATFSKHTIINGNQTRGSRGRAMEGISFIFNAFPLPYTAESIILLPWKYSGKSLSSVLYYCNLSRNWELSLVDWVLIAGYDKWDRPVSDTLLLAIAKYILRQTHWHRPEGGCRGIMTMIVWFWYIAFQSQ